jgi:hypothetical protein
VDTIGVCDEENRKELGGFIGLKPIPYYILSG